MDATRFDDLLRTLTAVPSRREFARILAGLAMGAAGVVAVAETEAGNKKKCPPCRVRRRGKCKKKKPDGTLCGDECLVCDNGACRPLADDTFCGGGGVCNRCRAGTCQVLTDGTSCDINKTCQPGGCLCAEVPVGNNKPVDAACDPQRPEECASGKCGCNGDVCPCFCRFATCEGPGGNCESTGTFGCCQGVCQFRPNEPDICSS